MEIIDKNAGLVCNYELLEVLGKHYAREKEVLKQDRDLRNILWIKQQCNNHFRHSPAAVQNVALAQQFVTAMEPFHLTNAEIVQILNLRPASLAHLHPLIEHLDERLTDAQREDLLTRVAAILPEAPGTSFYHSTCVLFCFAKHFLFPSRTDTSALITPGIRAAQAASHDIQIEVAAAARPAFAMDTDAIGSAGDAGDD